MDAKSLTKEDLTNLLIAYGFEDAQSYDRWNAVNVLKAMGVEFVEEASSSSTVERSTPPNVTRADEPIDLTAAIPPIGEVLAVESGGNDNRALANSIEGSGESTDLTHSETSVAETAAVPSDASEVAPAEEPSSISAGPTAEQEAIISSFCDVSGSDRDFARSVLMDLGWDLDTAIVIFLEGGIHVPPKVTEPERTTFNYGEGNFFQSSGGIATTRFGLRNPQPVTVGGENETTELGDDSEDRRRAAEVDGHSSDANPMDLNGIMNQLRMHHRRFMGSGNDDDDGDDEEDTMHYGGFGEFAEARRARQERERPQQFYEDGVRVNTDPIKMQRLLSRGHSGDETDHIILGRADDPDVEWLVEPARHLSYLGSLNHAKGKALAESRYLLVNIQSHEQFASSELNRDTWRDEAVESILRGPYLFWQRGHTSHDGKEFMRLYRIAVEDLPVCAIIEPNTGARLLSMKGYIEPIDMAARLIEFYEKHSMSRQPSPMPVAQEDAKTNDDNLKDSGSERPVELVEKVGPSEVEEVSPKFDISIYGEVPSEPAETDPDALKLSIKLPSRRLIKRFRSSDTVRCLFAYVAQQDVESSTRAFDLIFRGPPLLALHSNLDATLQECNLRNAQIFHSWL